MRETGIGRFDKLELGVSRNWNLEGENAFSMRLGEYSNLRVLPQSSFEALQASHESSCPSRNHRLLPALANNIIGHHRAKLGAGYARPMQALAFARQPDG